MGDSFISFIILIVLFFILPSVLKMLGKYTMNSKESGMNEMETEEDKPSVHMSDLFETRHKHEYEIQERPEISNKPIEPKWF